MRNLIGSVVSTIVLVLSVETLVAQQQNQPSTKYLERAIEVANWLDSVAIESENGTCWPSTPEDTQQPSAILYNGTPGVILFYVELYRATGNKAYLETAVAGGDWLIEQTKKLDDNSNAAFYTGAAGMGYTLDLLHGVSHQQRFRDASDQVFDWVVNSAKITDDVGIQQAKWNDVTDIVGGSSGIGFYLLDVARRNPAKKEQAMKLAKAVGEQLLIDSISCLDRHGRKWNMSPDFPREMPNYSHGTAGVCDYLLALDMQLAVGDEADRNSCGRYVSMAMAGAAYLESLAYKNENSNLIPHHFPEEGKLFYLGWCHGPTGTVGFLNRLANYESVLNESKRWKNLANKLTHAMMATGIPESRTDGFWNNCGLCCGNAGAASFLFEYSIGAKNENARLLANKLTDDLLQRATKVKLDSGKTGLKWTHAEHRVRPEYLKAQTGLMQGASGIGIWLIKRHRIETGDGELIADLPLFPF